MPELSVGDKVYFLRAKTYIARGVIRVVYDDYYVLYNWECLDTGHYHSGRIYIGFDLAFSSLEMVKKAKMVTRMLKK